MARLSVTTRAAIRRRKFVAVIQFWFQLVDIINQMMDQFWFMILLYYKVPSKPYTIDGIHQRGQLRQLVYTSDTNCIAELRMNRSTFGNLCSMLETLGGLKPTKYMMVDEQVALFLHILAHHVKNRVIRGRFRRSTETVSRCFKRVLDSVISLQEHLLKKPEPIKADSTDARWKWFENCLGAIDGTYVKVRAPLEDKAKYRNRKGDIATNVLGVCAPNMQFIYVLAGWEGSAADGRVLRDAISRRNGLKVPRGCYYLGDAGYTNCEGFLAPFRGQRYHLNDWRNGHQPTTPKEFFNMKHSSARNVIERCFGLLKMRWAILRSHSFYGIRTQNRIIIACCLLHNFIRQQMRTDPIEEIVDNGGAIEYITSIAPSDQWTNFRTNLATQMFDEWRET